MTPLTIIVLLILGVGLFLLSRRVDVFFALASASIFLVISFLFFYSNTEGLPNVLSQALALLFVIFGALIILDIALYEREVGYAESSY